MDQNNFQLPTLEQLVEVLKGVLSGNNQLIQQSTKYLRVYTKLKDSINPLLTILVQSQDAQYRQLSAVLLKRNMGTIFDELDPETKNILKSTLLDRFFNEQLNSIRNCIGAVMGLIAVICIPDKQWNELFVTIAQKTNESQPLETRQRGLQLLGLILDHSGDFMDEYYNEFYTFFTKTIQDPVPSIRKETLKCLAYLFANIYQFDANHEEKFSTLIDPMLVVLDQCIKENDDDVAYLCFDVFNCILESKASKLLDKHISIIIQYVSSQNVLLNKNLSTSLKEIIMDFIQNVSENKRKFLSKDQPLLKLILEVLFTIAAQPLTEDDISDESQPIQDSAIGLIEYLAINIPKKKIYSLLIQNIEICVSTGDPDKMQAGLLILGGICEGCFEQLRKDLQIKLMEKIIPAVINHPSAMVKGAGIHALSYMSEFLQPDILMYHSTIIPALINNLQDIDPVQGQTEKQYNEKMKIASKAMSSLEIFCQSLEDYQIKPYLSQLIAIFGKIINSNVPAILKVFAMCCIGTVMDAAQNEYLPYFQDTITMIDHIIKLKNAPEIQELQCEAIINLGKISSTFCKEDLEKFKTFIMPYMDPLYQLLINNQEYKIREATLTFFYHVAMTIKQEFGGFIDKLMKFVFETITSESGFIKEPKQKKNNEFSLDSDSEEEDFDPEGKSRPHNTNTRQDFLDEKAAAIKSLGCFAVACPMQFVNYFEKSFEILETCYNFFYDNIRIQTVSAYKDLCVGMVMASNNGVMPPVQRGIPIQSSLPEKIKSYIQIEVVTKYLYYMESDDSQEVVQATIESFDQLISEVGAVVVEKCQEDLVNAINKLLRGEGNCQIPMDEEEEEEDEETNLYVFEALTDLIPTLSKALRAGFILLFQKLYESMFIYTSKNRDINDNIQIIGTFAQCIKYCPELVPNLSQKFIQFLLQNVNKDEQLDRNLIYCLGLMVEGNAAHMDPCFNDILLVLRNIYENSKYPENIDNSIAALCRMIMGNPQKVPLQEAVMNNIFKITPLKGDKSEEKTIIRFCMFLCDHNAQVATQNIQKIIQLFLDAIVLQKEYELKDTFVQKVAQYTKSIYQQSPEYAQYIESLVNQLDQQQKSQVTKFMQ